MAEMMADLRSLTGLSASLHGYFNAAPSPERLRQVMHFYGMSKFLDIDH